MCHLLFFSPCLFYFFLLLFLLGDLNRAALPLFAFVETTSRADLGVHGLGLCLGPASPPGPALIFLSFSSPRPELLSGEERSGACCCLSLEENSSSLMWKVENKIDDCTLYLQGGFFCFVLFSPSPPCRYERISVQGNTQRGEVSAESSRHVYLQHR